MISSVAARATQAPDWYDSEVGQTHPKDEEHDEFAPGDEPEAESVLTSGEPEPQGVADGEELVLAQLEELQDEGGLDVEAGVEGGLDITTMVDADEPEGPSDDLRADAVMEDGGLIDAAGDEDGWTEGSEGDSEPYQADFNDDDDDAHHDDGGVDGTDDPLHDGIDEDALPPLHGSDSDDTLIDDIDQDLLREITQEV